METKRIYNLAEQEYLAQRTCFMHNDNSFSLRSSFNPDPVEFFNKRFESKTIQVEEPECSKRSLAFEEDLVVPLKKRKQLPHASDVFIDENLPKSDDEESSNVTLCSEVKERFLDSDSSTSQETIREGQIEFDLQASVFVKADDSTEFVNLKCFDSILSDGSTSATFFAGGPIQSSAFPTTPSGKKVNQYIAVAVGGAIHDNNSYVDTMNVSGVLQFWNLGSLHKRKILNQRPSMDLALYHHNGVITEMKWCPVNVIYAKHPSSSRLPRLGVLAVSSSDSNVYIYNVPQPDSLPKIKPKIPIYFTLPSMKLTPLFGEPSHAAKKTVATCIDWEKNGERIVAGYGNGAVCVWMLKASSITSSIGLKSTDQSIIIQPYLFFQPSGASIVDLSFAPFNTHRWLAVISNDNHLQCFDLYDTSFVPFKSVKQGLERSCIWGETFCGIYTSPRVNGNGRISVSAKDCCGVTPVDKNIWRKFFDSSTKVAVSENKNYHAIADMSGALTVNVLKIPRPLEPSYITYLLFQVETMALDRGDPKWKTSQSKINISGNILNHGNASVNDTKDFDYSKIKQGSSSSSSSGFCSSKNLKTIIIEMPQGFGDGKVHLLTNPTGCFTVDEFKDNNNNNKVGAFLNHVLNPDEETNGEKVKGSKIPYDLMRDLLMAKISDQTKDSPKKLRLICNEHSACFDCKGAKHLSDSALTTTSVASDYTGDTIIYPLEDYYCDTSHTNALKSEELSAQSKNLNLNAKRNVLNKPTVQKLTRKSALEANFLRSGNSCSNGKSSARSLDETSAKNCNLNFKNKNCSKIDFGFNRNLFHSNDYNQTFESSDKEDSSKSTTVVSFSQNLDIKRSFILGKDPNLSMPGKCEKPFCDIFRSKNFKQSSSTKTSDFIVCDKDQCQLPGEVFNQVSDAISSSSETIMYPLELIDDSNSNLKKPMAIPQSFFGSDQQNNTFHKTLLSKRNNIAQESLKCNSKSEPDSVTENYDSSEEAINIDQKNFLTSDFHLLCSEYFCDSSEEKHISLNELPQSKENPQKLSYENLIAKYGVVFKNNLGKSASPLIKQKNNVSINYNPLSVIKTISWDPNEGCQSWLFVGSNSGIGRLVFVPDLAATKNKK